MTPEEIREVIGLHGKFLRSEAGGIKADLRRADLRRANLREADLRRANLREADLYGANLRRANLRGADLYGANLRRADLHGANLRGADLYGANLRRADLHGADLREADLRRANLRGADLYGANLREADLPAFQIPEGELIGWKKCSGAIVKLLIPRDADRTASLVGRKCRASRAVVVGVYSSGDQAWPTSDHDGRTVYMTGQEVIPDSYDPDPRIECTNGIHFFLTRQEAIEY